MTIKRVWHGWTTLDNAEAYQKLLHDLVFPGIEAKQIPGYRKIELFRQDLEEEAAFVTVMTFDTLDNVIRFQGQDYRRCYVPDAARKLLKRWDKEASHYELVETRTY